jgi:CubicO group peptidase (beta-lactamase class C family)
MSIDDFCRRELTEPLNADFQFQLVDKEERARVASLVFMDGPIFDEGTFEDEVMSSIDEPADGVDPWNSWEHQSAIMPGAIGLASAKGLAKIAGMFSLGGIIDGKRILSEEVIKEARTEQVHTSCPLMGEIRMGLGFGLDSPGFRAPTPECYHWGGYGGSVCVIDPINQTGFAYAMNRCITDEQAQEDGGIDMIDSRLGGFWKAYQSVGGASE